MTGRLNAGFKITFKYRFTLGVDRQSEGLL